MGVDVMKFEVLDCTLRDGGYYTDWFFPKDLVMRYCDAIAETTVGTVEIGYLSPLKPGGSGPYFYLGRSEIEQIRAALPADRKIAVMMNYKDVSVESAARLMRPVADLVDIVRFACPPAEVQSCIEIAKVVHAAGAEVAINVMYLSKYSRNAEAVLKPLAAHADVVQYVSLVDSYGSCFPDEVAGAIRATVGILPQKIGFHGHDNVGLAFANALAAIEAGAHIVDSTITGMGRGAGNLRTELMMAYAARGGNDTPFGAISESLVDFEKLRDEYGWGTNLPYMISGFNGLPQADVMDWLGTKRYTVSSIVSALQGKDAPVDTTDVAPLTGSDFAAAHGGRPVIIVGGGPSINANIDGIRRLAESAGAPIILSSLRHAKLFADVEGPLLTCLAGQEAQRKRMLPADGADRCFVVTPGPRLKGSVPQGRRSFVADKWLDVGDVHLGPVSDVAPLELALGTALGLEATKIWLCGFDGFDHASIADQANAQDVQRKIDLFVSTGGRPPLASITPTLYDIRTTPLYGLLSEMATGEAS